jgi:hypothetical protein
MDDAILVSRALVLLFPSFFAMELQSRCPCQAAEDASFVRYANLRLTRSRGDRWYPQERLPNR